MNQRFVVFGTIGGLLYGSIYMNAYIRDTITVEEKRQRRSLIQNLPELLEIKDGTRAELYAQLQENKRNLQEIEVIEHKIESKVKKYNEAI